MPILASCPLIVCSWLSGLLGLGSRGSAVDAEILSMCVLPFHRHECIRYFIGIYICKKEKPKLKPAATLSQPEKKEIKVTIMHLSSVYRLNRFHLGVTMGAVRMRAQKSAAWTDGTHSLQVM